MSGAPEDIGEKLVAAYSPSNDDVVTGRLTAIVAEAHARQVDAEAIDQRLASWASLFPFRRAAWATADEALADLRLRVLTDPATRRAKFRDRLRALAGWVFDHYIAVASLVALTASALYGLAYARFYGAMSITPEQAGLSTTQIVANSAAGGFALLLLISLMIFLTVLPIVPPKENFEAEGEEGSWSGFVGHAAVSAMGILGLLSLAEVFNLDPQLLGGALGMAMCFALMGLRLKWRGLAVPLEPKPMDFSLDRYLVVLVALVLPAALLLTGVLTVVKAGELGKRASSGEAVRDADVLEMPILGVRAEPALLRWRTEAPADFPDCALYLGAANGQVILHDHLSGSTVQVPSDNLDVVFRKQMSSCEAPTNSRLPVVQHFDDDHLECRHGGWRSGGAEVDFSYEWMYRGDSVFDQRVVSIEELLPRPVVRCRVTATSALGSNAATSQMLVADGAR